MAGNEDAHIISEELNRLDRIVKDFLQFARPADPELVRVPAERVLEEVRDFMKLPLEQAAIDLKLEVAEPAWILADTYQLKQVLINLVQNAADAIGQNGTVRLRARSDRQRLGDAETAVVILEVADTGSGIPPAVQERLFDPFFTTKETGTGLGLSIAAGIVQKHGGAIQYQTEVNHGTTFGIILPATA